MNKSNLWSLRLGFSGKHAQLIEELGFEKFLNQSYATTFEKTLPTFLDDEPKSLAELKELRQSIKNGTADDQKKVIKKQIKNATELKKWWIDKFLTEKFPLREKMTCFWHNHFVATS